MKVYRTSNGELAYKLTKHTDWITALEFSPDGRLLATADRAGGLHLWDAPTGGIALSLNEHKESITSVSWRTDSRLLASASDPTCIGLIWLTQPPQHEVRVAGIVNARISIMLGADNHREEATLRLPMDAKIMGFLPHLHLRGKA